GTGAVTVTDDHTRRRREQSERAFRGFERGKARRRGAKTPLKRVSSCGVDNDDFYLGAPAVHLGQNNVDADAVAPNVGLTPDLSIDRDQIRPPVHLQSEAAEVKQRLGVFGD